MARRRLVSPEFFAHAGLFDLEQATGLHIRLAFEGLWTVADRRGLFEWKPRELKLKCLPYDVDDFEAVLSALESGGFIRSYAVDGKKYAQVPSFGRWQTFHKHEKQNDCPDPPRLRDENQQKSANGGADPSSDGTGIDKNGSNTPVVSTVTVTSTSTVAASIPLTPIVAPVDGATFRQQCRLLVGAANSGLQKRFGMHHKPLLWEAAGTYQAVELMHKSGVDLTFAANALHERSAELRSEKPPKSLNYFTLYVEEQWRAEQARSDAHAFEPSRKAKVLDQVTVMAIGYARAGDADWKTYCVEHHIDWSNAP